jgi:hypothetical protein
MKEYKNILESQIHLTQIKGDNGKVSLTDKKQEEITVGTFPGQIDKGKYQSTLNSPR